MCLICTDWQKGKLTFSEAVNNLNEMLSETSSEEQLEHAGEALELIIKDIQKGNTDAC